MDFGDWVLGEMNDIVDFIFFDSESATFGGRGQSMLQVEVLFPYNMSRIFDIKNGMEFLHQLWFISGVDLWGSDIFDLHFFFLKH